MRDDQLSLLQELVSNADTFTEQAAGILADIEDQTFKVSHLIECFGYFVLGGLLESGNVHVSDARLDHEMQVDAVARDLVADDRKFQRTIGAFTEHGDADSGSLGSLEQI